MENICDIFTIPVLFFQVIDPGRSKVKMLGTKVEINLRKAEPGSWKDLELPPASKDTDS